LLIFFIKFNIQLQSAVLHSDPKATVRTPAFSAPEVLLRKEYSNGKVTWDFINHFLDGLKNHVSNHFLWLLTAMIQQLTNSNSTVSYRLKVHRLVKFCRFSYCFLAIFV